MSFLSAEVALAVIGVFFIIIGALAILSKSFFEKINEMFWRTTTIDLNPEAREADDLYNRNIRPIMLVFAGIVFIWLSLH